MISTRKFILGSDTYIMHKRAVDIAGDIKGKSILDVGGEGNLKQFLKNGKIISVNIKEGDVIATGVSLPFKENSFDAVFSLDVLEHINKEERKKFVKELMRVAEEKVIICAPYGTEKHIEFEKEMA